jgi:hypothetical protein
MAEVGGYAKWGFGKGAPRFAQSDLGGFQNLPGSVGAWHTAPFTTKPFSRVHSLAR